jgi:hypothetical protein
MAQLRRGQCGAIARGLTLLWVAAVLPLAVPYAGVNYTGDDEAAVARCHIRGWR